MSGHPSVGGRILLVIPAKLVYSFHTACAIFQKENPWPIKIYKVYA
jgi:hypothetical protein